MNTDSFIIIIIIIYITTTIIITTIINRLYINVWTIINHHHN